jgi:hypothetical protein
VIKHFNRGAPLPGNSNPGHVRYEQACKYCGENFTEAQSAILVAHIMKYCSKISEADGKEVVGELSLGTAEGKKEASDTAIAGQGQEKTKS